MRTADILLDTAKPAMRSSMLLVRVGRPTPWVFLSCVEGYLTLPGAQVIAGAVLSQTSSETRHMVVFHDWSKMTDYDSDARVLLTGVARSILPVCQAVHVHVTSTKVAFGVRAAGLVIPRILLHKTMASFAAALETAAATPTRQR